MKNLRFALLTSAVALAIAPIALADSYNFNFSGPVTSGSPGTITFNIAFTTNSSATPTTTDAYTVTSITSGTYSDTGDGISGAVSLYPGNGTATNASPQTTADGSFIYDNEFYPNDDAPTYTTPPFTTIKTTAGGYFDGPGLLFYVSPAGHPDEYEVDFYATGSDTYAVEEGLSGSYQDFQNAGTSPTGLTLLPGGDLTNTPEPTPLILLGTGLLGLALIAFRKHSKQRAE